MIRDQKLEYDNSIDTNGNILRFETKLAEKRKNSIFDEKTMYEVTFNKMTKKIDVDYINHRFLEKRYTEEELDTIVENIVSQFNLNLINYNKTFKI